MIEQAERLYQYVLNRREQVLGEEHPSTIVSLYNFGSTLCEQRKYAEVEPLFQRVLELRKRTLGSKHSGTLTSVNNLAWLYLDQHTTDGKPHFTRLIEAWSDPTDWKHHWAKLGLALTNALESGDFTPAESTIVDLTNLLGEEHDRVGKAHSKLLSAREFYQARE